jgi:hydroxyethylthiazole kinase-like uncharacterized protein yjeF
VRAVLGADVPVLVDADAITVLADHHDWLRRRRAPTVLTPHEREFGRLLDVDPDSVSARRLHWARTAARELQVTVLLKGSTTVVADPSGDVRVNTTGDAWLATAGSGDVLTGLCGALLAQGLGALDAAAAGAFLHGLAGRLAAGSAAAQAPISASDVVRAVPDALRAVCGGTAVL